MTFRFSPRSESTVTDQGWIFEAYDGSARIGRVGRLHGDTKWYATPYGHSPFITTNGVRIFSDRQRAAAWLAGIRDASSAWLVNAGQNLT